MTNKSIPFPPRGLRLEWACAYVGLGRSKFLQEVEAGAMPKPVSVGRCKIWDREKLDRAFDRLNPDATTGDEWGESMPSGLPKWCSEYQDRHGRWRVRARLSPA